MRNVLSRGSIRVDARRAVAKLREHLLVDLHLYALEIARSAVAAGATWLDVRCDGGDVEISFDGAPIPPSTLGRVLDHVLDESGAPEARRLRLLALGLNAALGLKPAHVDLVCAGPPSARVRWTPEMLDESGAGPEAVPIASAPADLPAGAVRIVVRRRFGWGALQRAVVGGLPREIELLAEAAADAPLRLTIDGQPLAPARSTAILRVPFSAPGARRAFVELCAPEASAPPPEIAFLEQGVTLCRRPLGTELGAFFPARSFDGVELPVRVMVDAAELPTNASRSALREDAALARLAGEGAAGALEEIAVALGAAFSGTPLPPGTKLLTPDRALLEAAAGALCCVVEGAVRVGASLPAAASLLLDLPLLRSATGEPLAPSAIPRGEAPIALHRGEAPVDAWLAPWMRGVVWVRGTIAERVLTGRAVVDAASLIDQARAAAARRARLLERAAGEPVLPELAEGDRPLFRASFDEREGEHAGLRGEVAVLAGEHTGARVHAFVEGRPLETVSLAAATIPLPLDVAVAWEGRLRARFAYDGVEQDLDFRRAVHRAVLVAVLAVDREARNLVHDRDRAAPLAPLHRAAIAALGASADRLDPDHGARDPAIASFAGLHALRLWPTTRPGHLESLHRLREVSETSRALAVAAPGVEGEAADNRPVICAPARELGWLARALGGVELVPYGDALLRPGEDQRDRDKRRAAALAAWLGRDLTESRGVGLPLWRFGVVGLVVPSAWPRLVLAHAGRVLTERPQTALGRVAIALDDDTLMPNRAWDGARTEPSAAVVAWMERTFLSTLISALEGGARALATLGASAPKSAAELAPLHRAYLLDRAAALGQTPGGEPVADREGATLAARIDALPLLAILDERGQPAPASVDAVLARRPSPERIPVLRAPPGFETLAWRPLLVSSESELEVLQRRFAGRLYPAEIEVPARLSLAAADRERRAFLAGPEHDPLDPGDLADRSAPVVHLRGRPSVTAALPRAVLPAGHAWADVLFAGRALCRRGLPELPVPVVARVALTSESHIEGFRDLSRSGLTEVVTRVRAAAEALGLAILDRASGPGRGGALFGDLRALSLLGALLATRPPAERAQLASALAAPALLWPTAQGEEQPFGELHVTASGELAVGHDRFVSWIRPASGKPAQLDRPILHLPLTPEGEALGRLVQALGKNLHAVTPALAALQARRAASAPLDTPRLAGAPPHPALRVSLASIGVRSAEGELELIDAEASDVSLIELDGTAKPVPADLPFPVRVLCRTDGSETSREATKALLTEMVRAAGRYVLSLVPRLAELPPFVRVRLRRVVVRAATRRKKVGRAAANAPVFEDILGGYHSLETIRRSREEQPIVEWACTRDPPPYARRSYPAVVLRLNDEEAKALGALLGLKDYTAVMRWDLEGERRATAPPAASIALGAEDRRRCLEIVRFNDGGATGEIGLLAPEHAASRGLHLSTGRRALCDVVDGPGWPIVVALDSDAFTPNRRFDGLRTPTSAWKLRARLRAAIAPALRSLVKPPADALAVRWLDGGGDAEPGTLAVLGALWLPAVWPASPRVRVTIPGSGGRKVGRSLVLSESPPYLLGDVPVEGELHVTADGPWHAVATEALKHAVAMLDELLGAGTNEGAALDPARRATIERYRWDLRLLGFSEAGEPVAPTATGEVIGPAAVLEELALSGALWASDRRGSVDGLFPSAEKSPSFVLLSEGSALVDVLRQRAAPDAFHVLGADPAAERPVPAPDRSEAIVIAPPATLAAPAVEAGAPAGASWFGELWRAVRSFFGQDEALVESELSRALFESLEALELAGRPLLRVAESASGRAIRYERASKMLVLNRQHRALRWLSTPARPDAHALALLTAAAVSEVNRALGEVTDEEERRALGLLLARLGGEETAGLSTRI